MADRRQTKHYYKLNEVTGICIHSNQKLLLKFCVIEPFILAKFGNFLLLLTIEARNFVIDEYTVQRSDCAGL